MNDNDAVLTFYEQEKLSAEVRDAGLNAAHAVLAEKGISGLAAIRAEQVGLLLADELDGDEPTDEDFQTHGSGLRAYEAYHAARNAASAEIARRDPATPDFKILFSLTD